MSTESRMNLVYEGIWVRPDSGSHFSIDDRRRFRKAVKELTDPQSTAEASLLLAAATFSSQDGGRIEKLRDAFRSLRALRKLCILGDHEAFGTIDLARDVAQTDQPYEMVEGLMESTTGRQKQITGIYIELLRKDLHHESNDFVQAYRALTETDISVE